MGEYSSPQRCGKSLHTGLEYYMLKYEEQQIFKLEHTNHGDAEEPLQISFNEVGEEKFSEYLQRKYISPMIYALDKGDLDEFKKLQAKFLRFSKDSPIKRDVTELGISMRKNGTSNGIRLYEAYLRKITAIKREDYEKAAQERDKIYQLKSEDE